jgi:formate C-acetyltransferase
MNKDSIMSIEKLRKELMAFYSGNLATRESPYPADPGNGALAKGWASASFDDSCWETMSLPGSWPSNGLRFSGVFWFRRAVDIPSAWAGQDSTLNIGAVDKTDMTYFNGELVGATGKGFDQSVWDTPRSYRVPGRMVKAGRNVIAVRVYSFIYDGGLIGPADKMYVSLADNRTEQRLSLAGDWKYAIEHNLGRNRGRGVPLFDVMDKHDGEHPGLNVYQLKMMQYDSIAENFHPQLFLNSPFYFEVGINGGWEEQSNPGRWLLSRNYHLFREFNPEEYDLFMERARQKYYLCCGPYVDLYHNCPSFSNVLKYGLSGIYAQAQAAQKQCKTKEESDFIACAMAGLLAAKRIAERFAEAAEEKLKETADQMQRRFLGLIARTAREVPWRKPETFFEGLNTLWFLREVSGLLEGLAPNSLGRPDAMLADLYKNDIETGRLTQEEAYDLVCRFLLPGDCHYDKNKQVVGYGGIAGHELEITLTLGGCDEKGHEVFNDITRMFLKAYSELKLIYPKPHCRFSRSSSPEYLEIINREIIAGRSVYSLVNDDCIIPALVRDGKSPADARRYLCTGCWDIVVESCEDMATGNYFNMARVLEMSIYDCPEEMAMAKLSLEKLDGAETFEEVYRRLFGNIIKVTREMCEMKGRNGIVWARANPSPFFSACMSDCLEARKDFTAGGGRYNPNALSMVFFANIIDSLLAIRKLCFETKHHSLAELLDAVRTNWKGQDALRAEVLAAPYFGDNEPESNALARRLHDDIYANTRDLRNERGGSFELAYWVYREFRFWGETTRATPDGRRDGDYLAQSLNPSRLNHINEITSALNSVASLDLTKCPADSVLNILLPVGGLSPIILDQFERAYAALNLQLLQLNCINKEELLDARKHPEKHQDLIVRVCGFSAKFVSLPPEWQEEFINRNIYGESA